MQMFASKGDSGNNELLTFYNSFRLIRNSLVLSFSMVALVPLKVVYLNQASTSGGKFAPYDLTVVSSLDEVSLLDNTKETSDRFLFLSNR